ncbi:MAG: hypothetical protein KUL82_01050 [Bdellovibrio sp.]|uniref:hypothetical protein n=1 Tax=Bdellovibrio sp. TaxID=28201 RepID=UPI0039E4A28B|nr:hypothetical protein [Bdellovibrio sp.]
MVKVLVATAVLFASWGAQASSKCVLVKSHAGQRVRQEIKIDQENMRIEQSAGQLEATIQVIYGRLISMMILNKGNFTRAALPLDSIAESGGGALALEDMKTQSAIEMTCKMEY